MASKLDKSKSKRGIHRSAITKLETKITKYLEAEQIDCKELNIFKFQIIDQQNQINSLNNEVEDLVTDLEDLKKDVEESQKYTEKLIRMKVEIECKINEIGNIQSKSKDSIVDSSIQNQISIFQNLICQLSVVTLMIG